MCDNSLTHEREVRHLGCRSRLHAPTRRQRRRSLHSAYDAIGAINQLPNVAIVGPPNVAYSKRRDLV